MRNTTGEERRGSRKRGLWVLLAVVGLAVGLVVALGRGYLPGCSPKAAYRAGVTCAKVPGGIDCDVRHTKGMAAGNVCWDVTLTCENGKKVLGSGCQAVERGGRATAHLLAKDLEDYALCDAQRAIEVSNVRAVEDID